MAKSEKILTLLDSAVPHRFLICGKLVSEGDFLHVQRVMDCFALLLVCDGRLHIQQAGISHTVEKNEFFLLRPGVSHGGWKKSEGSLSYYWCHFTARGAPPVIGPETELWKSIRERSAGEYCLLPEYGRLAGGEKLFLLFRQLLDLEKASFCPPQRTDFALSLLLMELTQECLETDLRPDSASAFRMRGVAEWLKLNYSAPLSVGSVADHFGYNPDYLSAAYKRVYGATLLQAIRKTRVEAAKQLLLNSQLSIKEIARQSGFADEKNFMKVFRQQEDLTPTQYRNAFYRQTLNNK